MYVQFFYREQVEVNMINIDIANNVTHPSCKVKLTLTVNVVSRTVLKFLLEMTGTSSNLNS